MLSCTLPHPPQRCSCNGDAPDVGARGRESAAGSVFNRRGNDPRFACRGLCAGPPSCIEVRACQGPGRGGGERYAPGDIDQSQAPRPGPQRGQVAEVAGGVGEEAEQRAGQHRARPGHQSQAPQRRPWVPRQTSPGSLQTPLFRKYRAGCRRWSPCSGGQRWCPGTVAPSHGALPRRDGVEQPSACSRQPGAAPCVPVYTA